MQQLWKQMEKELIFHRKQTTASRKKCLLDLLIHELVVFKVELILFACLCVSYCFFSWMSSGVPGASLANHNEKYFNFHHSGGDTMTVQNPTEMDNCLAVWAATSYAVANLEQMLPRDPKQPIKVALA